jgi:hypothetical protein
VILEHRAERIGDSIQFLIDASNLRADQVAHVVEPLVCCGGKSEMRTLLKSDPAAMAKSVMASEIMFASVMSLVTARAA